MNEASIKPEMDCELIGNQDVRMLEGKLKTYVDSLGIDAVQRAGMKDMINILLWDWFRYYTKWRFTDSWIEKRDWYIENQMKSERWQKYVKVIK